MELSFGGWEYTIGPGVVCSRMGMGLGEWNGLGTVVLRVQSSHECDVVLSLLDVWTLLNTRSNMRGSEGVVGTSTHKYGGSLKISVLVVNSLCLHGGI